MRRLSARRSQTWASVSTSGPPSATIPGASRNWSSTRSLRRITLGESVVEDRLRDLMRSSLNPTIAPYAHTGECHVRLTARGTEAQVEPLLAGTEAAIRERLGPAVYGTGETTLEEAVAQAL